MDRGDSTDAERIQIVAVAAQSDVVDAVVEHGRGAVRVQQANGAAPADREPRDRAGAVPGIGEPAVPGNHHPAGRPLAGGHRRARHGEVATPVQVIERGRPGCGGLGDDQLPGPPEGKPERCPAG